MGAIASNEGELAGHSAMNPPEKGSRADSEPGPQDLGSLPNPLVSVVMSNQNGHDWLPRCFESLRKQTVFDRLEVIMVDNCSTDDSVTLAREALADFPSFQVIQNAEDLGFTGGNNVGVRAARSDLVFFLSNDTWLEPDCLEVLIRETIAAGADAAGPLVLNYADDEVQSMGAGGLDLFGMMAYGSPLVGTGERFALAGCGFLMKTAVFNRVGGFDLQHFMYAEETDLCWRVIIAGGKIVGVPDAKMHHRVHGRVTSETKRFLANRNGLLMLMKNGRNILLLLLLPQMVLLLAEALVSLVLVRRWSYVRKAYLSAIGGAFGLVGHVRQYRRRIRAFRQHGDLWMLRFIRFKPARWNELARLVRSGMPQINQK
jgi:GT2 family glycosyltransferase